LHFGSAYCVATLARKDSVKSAKFSCCTWYNFCQHVSNHVRYGTSHISM